jgi:hypothetical protein
VEVVGTVLSKQGQVRGASGASGKPKHGGVIDGVGARSKLPVEKVEGGSSGGEVNVSGLPGLISGEQTLLQSQVGQSIIIRFLKKKKEKKKKKKKGREKKWFFIFQLQFLQPVSAIVSHLRISANSSRVSHESQAPFLKREVKKKKNLGVTPLGALMSFLSAARARATNNTRAMATFIIDYFLKASDSKKMRFEFLFFRHLNCLV